MANFKCGDKVRVIKATMVVSKGWEGIVNEDNSSVPFVKFKDCEWAVDENNLVLVTEGDVDVNYEIY